MRIPTDVTALLGIDLPIVQAGMSWASSSSALPLAVSRAGGLGVIAAGPMRLDALARAIQEVRQGTDRPFAVNVPLSRPRLDEVFDLLAAEPPPVLICSQGGPARYLDRFKSLGVICVHVVGGVEHAGKAARQGADALVVVGGEAGGHPPPHLVSSLVLLRAVRRALPDARLIASGGYADGSALAAGLALGAGAVQFGSRFLASHEASVHPAYKRAVLDAGITDTRAVGRELGVVRVLRNAFTDAMTELESAGADLAARRSRFALATLRMAACEGDLANGRVEVGQTAGLINDVLPAATIVEQIAAEYRAAIQRLPAVLE